MKQKKAVVGDTEGTDSDCLPQVQSRKGLELATWQVVSWLGG